MYFALFYGHNITGIIKVFFFSFLVFWSEIIRKFLKDRWINSLDLNPNENVWHLMDSKISEKKAYYYGSITANYL